MRDDLGVSQQIPGGDDQPWQDLVGDDEPAPPPRPSARSITLTVGMVLTSALLAGLVLMHVPYVVQMPGPTRDVLGAQDDVPLIQIEGADTHDSTGELLLTTVSAIGVPGFPADVASVLRGWAASSSVVRPAEDVVPSGQTQEEADEANSQAMVSSQENASVAALSELGYEVPATLVIAGTVTGTGAEGLFEDGDVLVSLDGQALPDYQSLVTDLAAVEPGQTITLGVHRHGEDVDVPVVTSTRSDTGGAQIGVLVDPQFDMPIDITISIDGIGGPSAGTMFALGIIDALTPEDEANGQVIAGTGTIDVVGDVGAIGGIRQKMAGALRDGATWFLAPESNCDEVVGHVPAGLHVVKVATLHEAREAVAAIGAGETDDLPTCTAG